MGSPNQIDLKWFVVWSDATVNYSWDSLSMFTIQMLWNLVRGYVLGSCPFKKVFHYFVNSKYFQVFESSLTSSLYIRVTKSYAARSGCEIKAHVTRPWLLQIKLWQKIEKSTSWQIYTVDLTLLSSRFRFRSLLLKSAYLHLRLSNSRWLNFDPNLEPKMTSYFEISSENW